MSVPSSRDGLFKRQSLTRVYTYLGDRDVSTEDVCL
nr:MAG TPA: hypothetical protein [Caudoviricetes sp.]